MKVARMESAEATLPIVYIDEAFETLARYNVKLDAPDIQHLEALSKIESSTDEGIHAAKAAYNDEGGEEEQQQVEQEQG